MMIDIVQFELSGVHYALDVHAVREIVNMLPITPVPRSPEYIAGIINLRGDITNILNLCSLMSLDESDSPDRKIIILAPDIAGNSNVGLIVDDVQSVLRISEDTIESIDASFSKEAYVKGVIKIGEEKDPDRYLVILIDITKILSDILQYAGGEAA